jgi:hypothetical protein
LSGPPTASNCHKPRQVTRTSMPTQVIRFANPWLTVLHTLTSLMELLERLCPEGAGAPSDMTVSSVCKKGGEGLLSTVCNDLKRRSSITMRSKVFPVKVDTLPQSSWGSHPVKPPPPRLRGDLIVFCLCARSTVMDGKEAAPGNPDERQFYPPPRRTLPLDDPSAHTYYCGRRRGAGSIKRTPAGVHRVLQVGGEAVQLPCSRDRVAGCWMPDEEKVRNYAS